jgi:uncharacterized membrane protein
MAPLHVPDEGGHLYRAWLVSEGTCKAVPAVGDPAVYRVLYHPDYRDLDHRVTWIELPPHSTGHDLLNLRDDSKGSPLRVVGLFYAVNLYSCLPYLPAGVTIRAGRVFTDSPLALMYLGRFGNLVFYLGMVLVAMHLLPEFRLPLAILSLMPMSLHQAASLSADVVTMAVAFVLTAFILRLALSFEPAHLRRSDYVWLLAAVVAAGLCKSLAGLVFLVLLIPGARFPNQRTRWFTVAGCIFLAFGTAAVWQYANRSNTEIFATLKSAAGIQVDENTAAILREPAVFLSAVVRTTAFLKHEYLEEFVGKLAALDISLPGWIPWVYLALLFGTAAAGRTGNLSRLQRILLIGIFLVNVVALYAVVWTTEVSHLALTTDMFAGRGWISGLQGRYLIPFALLPLMAASGLTVRLRGRWLAAASLTLVVAVNAVALDLVWDRFQAHSSTLPNRLHLAAGAASLYDHRLICSRAPGAMPYLVTDGVRHLAPNELAVTSRGYRWPDDIIPVSDQELAAIPPGAPLQPPNDYDGKLVRRQGSGPEDAKVYVVRNGEKHWIIDGQWITRNGYHWPEDVHIIPGPDLAAIPEGAPIH